MWFERDISSILKYVVCLRPVTLITGPRQTGKTSLLRRLFPDHAYVSLDLPTEAEEAEEDGERFLAKRGSPLIVDEVQYAPRLMRFIKAAVDREPTARGRYLLTGSQQFSLMAGVTESLAGRLSLINLHSLSLKELECGTGNTAEAALFWRWMQQGGYPELHARGMSTERYYSDYVATYLERDVRQALKVRSLRDFDRFLRLCALRTGQLLNVHSLAADVGVAATTIKSWLSVLESSSVIVLLQPYYRNAGKRLVKTPKLYFLDTGLACFLTGLHTASALEQSALRGAFFETQVVAQLTRHFANLGLHRDVYFYRDHQGTEVDLVIPVGEKLRLIECKSSASPSTRVIPFEKLAGIYGEAAILSRTLITPRRGWRKAANGVVVGDCVNFEELEV